MNGNDLFIDTNILIYFLQGNERLTGILDGKQVHVSFITELESLSSNLLSANDEKAIRNFLKHCNIVEMNPSLKETVIDMRRASKLRLPDCIIAASAAHLNIPLLTADTAFKRLTQVEVAVFDLDS